jgi:hypothetical protein
MAAAATAEEAMMQEYYHGHEQQPLQSSALIVADYMCAKRVIADHSLILPGADFGRACPSSELTLTF